MHDDGAVADRLRTERLADAGVERHAPAEQQVAGQAVDVGHDALLDGVNAVLAPGRPRRLVEHRDSFKAERLEAVAVERLEPGHRALRLLLGGRAVEPERGVDEFLAAGRIEADESMALAGQEVPKITIVSLFGGIGGALRVINEKTEEMPIGETAVARDNKNRVWGTIHCHGPAFERDDLRTRTGIAGDPRGSRDLPEERGRFILLLHLDGKGERRVDGQRAPVGQLRVEHDAKLVAGPREWVGLVGPADGVLDLALDLVGEEVERDLRLGRPETPAAELEQLRLHRHGEAGPLHQRVERGEVARLLAGERLEDGELEVLRVGPRDRAREDQLVRPGELRRRGPELGLLVARRADRVDEVGHRREPSEPAVARRVEDLELGIERVRANARMGRNPGQVAGLDEVGDDRVGPARLVEQDAAIARIRVERVPKQPQVRRDRLLLLRECLDPPVSQRLDCRGADVDEHVLGMRRACLFVDESVNRQLRAELREVVIGDDARHLAGVHVEDAPDARPRVAAHGERLRLGRAARRMLEHREVRAHNVVRAERLGHDDALVLEAPHRRAGVVLERGAAELVHPDAIRLRHLHAHDEADVEPVAACRDGARRDLRDFSHGGLVELRELSRDADTHLRLRFLLDHRDIRVEAERLDHVAAVEVAHVEQLERRPQPAVAHVEHVERRELGQRRVRGDRHFLVEDRRLELAPLAARAFDGLGLDEDWRFLEQLRQRELVPAGQLPQVVREVVVPAVRGELPDTLGDAFLRPFGVELGVRGCFPREHYVERPRVPGPRIANGERVLARRRIAPVDGEGIAAAGRPAVCVDVVRVALAEVDIDAPVEAARDARDAALAGRVVLGPFDVEPVCRLRHPTQAPLAKNRLLIVGHHDEVEVNAGVAHPHKERGRPLGIKRLEPDVGQRHVDGQAGEQVLGRRRVRVGDDDDLLDAPVIGLADKCGFPDQLDKPRRVAHRLDAALAKRSEPGEGLGPRRPVVQKHLRADEQVVGVLDERVLLGEPRRAVQQVLVAQDVDAVALAQPGDQRLGRVEQLGRVVLPVAIALGRERREHNKHVALRPPTVGKRKRRAERPERAGLLVHGQIECRGRAVRRRHRLGILLRRHAARYRNDQDEREKR